MDLIDDIIENGIDTVLSATPEEAVELLKRTNPEVLEEAVRVIVLAKQGRLIRDLLQASEDDADTPTTEDVGVEVPDGNED